MRVLKIICGDGEVFYTAEWSPALVERVEERIRARHKGSISATSASTELFA